MAPSILKGKKVNLLKLTGIIAGCFLVIKIIFPANTFWEWLEIYPIMLVSYFFIKKKRMDQTDMYFYGANLVRILFDQWLYDIIDRFITLGNHT